MKKLGWLEHRVIAYVITKTTTHSHLQNAF